MRNILVALATAIHLLPHPLGVSPIGALAIYSGAYGETHKSLLTAWIPLLGGLALTGMYSAYILLAVFVGFAASSLIGRMLLSRRKNLPTISVAICAAAITFFLVSNFAVWLVYYPKTFAGMLVCYLNAIPFLGIAILADSIYCLLLFGLHSRIARRASGHSPVTA